MPFSETVTESFGQLVIQGILLMRFDWLVKKDDFDSFGINFQMFVLASMSISFFTMVKAVLAYHNRTRESLRMVFSLSSFCTVLMLVVILLVKIGVYIFGFQNTPGLFFVPVIVKISLTWVLMSIFDPNFPLMAAHDKITYLLVSFLVPTSIPSKDKKKSRMGRNYGISLFLFYAECSLIVLYAVIMKKYYLFELFRGSYKKIPKFLGLSHFNFETVLHICITTFCSFNINLLIFINIILTMIIKVAFLLFLICLAATLVSGILRCLQQEQLS